MNLENEIKEALMRHGTDVQTRRGAWTEIEHRVARSRKRRIVAGAVAGALAITGAALALPRIGAERKPAPLLTEGPEPASTGAPTLQKRLAIPAFELATGPEQNAVMPDAVWGLIAATKARENGRLVRIDPATNKESADTATGENPVGLAVDHYDVWVAHNDGCVAGEVCLGYETAPIPRNSVARFDPKTLELVSTIKFSHPLAIDASFGAVWVVDAGTAADPATRLVRIEPATNEATTAVRLSGVDGPAEIIHGEVDLYVLHTLRDGRYEVLSISPDTRVVRVLATVESTGTAAHIALGAGALWVTIPGEHSVSALMRINPVTGEVLDRLDLPDAFPIGPTSITTGYWHVWAGSSRGNLSKVKVDRQSNKLIGIVGDPIVVGDAPIRSLLTAYNAVWVAVDGTVSRYAP